MSRLTIVLSVIICSIVSTCIIAIRLYPLTQHCRHIVRISKRSRIIVMVVQHATIALVKIHKCKMGLLVAAKIVLMLSLMWINYVAELLLLLLLAKISAVVVHACV